MEDQTDDLEFVVWRKGSVEPLGSPTKKGLPLKEGKSYLLKSVVTNEYQRRFSIAINRATEIREIEDLEL